MLFIAHIIDIPTVYHIPYTIFYAARDFQACSRESFVEMLTSCTLGDRPPPPILCYKVV